MAFLRDRKKELTDDPRASKEAVGKKIFPMVDALAQADYLILLEEVFFP